MAGLCNFLLLNFFDTSKNELLSGQLYIVNSIVAWVQLQIHSIIQVSGKIGHWSVKPAVAVTISCQYTVNLLGFYNECCSLIGYATHYLCKHQSVSEEELSADSCPAEI